MTSERALDVRAAAKGSHLLRRPQKTPARRLCATRVFCGPATASRAGEDGEGKVRSCGLFSSSSLPLGFWVGATG
ncbi:MAG TPA: hypothetical protein PLJ27_13405 [Polyangiaceae bacterium]|jgi:hypothetical protein|nr:MAG: hypothetical protein BWY17_03911 [Deltaproteobacteria bacterium ADurb.Bin207]HNS98380.1 hypothetical protein [Polyangiaceae bacterium]HNZ22853.1 hypothetical protein [Polyangiaceae bacterium]HOD21316.1 hypothetical protein [Polyangiaceae bacterium]HOE48475.1 hypothetical protein [Polyangiaceae bacterium]